MAINAQMTANMLNAEKGWPSQTALDFHAKISATVLYPLRAGQCCQLNSAGQLVPGCVAWAMPLFIFQGANDLDVNTDGGTGVDAWYPVNPTGTVTCFVGKGGYELWTTAYDTAQTYLINQPLRAPSGLAANQELISGVLTNQNVVGAASATPASATAVVGIVSRGARVNAYGKNALWFWPVHIPGNASET